MMAARVGGGGKRLVALFALLVLLGLVLAALAAALGYGAVYLAARRTLVAGLEERAEDLARQEARRVAGDVLARDTYALFRLVEEIVASRPELWLGAGVWGRGGETLVKSTGFPAAAEDGVREFLSASEPAERRVTVSVGEWALVVEPVRARAERVGSLVLVYNIALVEAQLRHLGGAALRGGGVIFLAAVALGVPLTAWISRPIRRIGAVVERAAAGDLAVRADEAAWGEAGALGGGVNCLLARTEALLEEMAEARKGEERARWLASMSQLGAGLAHEIRNPLTTVKLLLDHLVRAAGSAEVRVPARDLRMLESQVAKIDTVLEEFVALARPAGVLPTSFDLGAFAQDCVRSLEMLAEEADVRLVVEPGPPSAVWADRGKLDQALRHLAQNAIQHAPRGTAVAVGWDLAGGDAVLWVEDQGRGVPEELRDRIFEPFFSQRAGGFGLGLALVRSIAEQHGGATEVVTGSGGGARFKLRLPRVGVP